MSARPAPAVDRVVGVLELLAAHPDRPLTLSELCRQLGMSKATAHALLAALTNAGFLVRHPRDKTYRLGPGLFAVANAAAGHRPDLVDYAADEMAAVADELGVQCVATAVVGDEIALLRVAGTARPLSVHVQAGQRVPLAPPVGTVFLAWSSEQTIDRWLLRLGPDATPAELAHYRQALGSVRRRGYALSLESDVHLELERAMTNGEHPVDELVDELGHQEYLLTDLHPEGSYHLSLIAAPVFDHEGRVAMALSLFDLPFELDADRVVGFARRLVGAAHTVTVATGGRPPT